MKRTLVSILCLLFLLAMVPATFAIEEEVGLDEEIELLPGEVLLRDEILEQDPVIAFRGDGSATALDLAIPALNGLNKDLAKKFPGVTLGHTESSFSSAPEVKGRAAGNCSLLNLGVAADTEFEDLCSGSTIEKSDAVNPGDNIRTCAATAAPLASSEAEAVVSISTACGYSSSRLEQGLPVSTNEAGVAETKVRLDLTSLNPAAEASKDYIVEVLSIFSNVIFQLGAQIPVEELQAKQDKLELELESYLDAVADGQQAASIIAGASKTLVGHTDEAITVDSEAAGATIGLLGAPSLSGVGTDWLITIDVSAGEAHAEWSPEIGKGRAFATPAVATISVRDLLDLCSGSVPVGACVDGYIGYDVTVEDLNKYFQALSTVPQLATTIEVASATEDVEGASVAASASAVKIHALKGLGATDSKGNLDVTGASQNGGIVLRLAGADARIAGDLVLGAKRVIERELPVTGGPTFLYIGASLLLAAGAVWIYRVSRRVAGQV